MTEIDNLATRLRLEKTISIVLAGTRNDFDVSQRELAARIGWTRNMVANIETQRRSTRLVDFILIANALHIDPMALLKRILGW
jgi:transcriptional regulator with XRE-family HTH domain